MNYSVSIWKKAVNTLLKTELTAFLDYEKYDRIGFNTGNSRNGSYDRNGQDRVRGTSSPDSARPQRRVQAKHTVPAYRRTNDTLEETVIQPLPKKVLPCRNRRLD